MTQQIRSRFGHMAVFAIVALVSLSAFRLGILSLNFSRIDAGLVPNMLLYGVRFDLIVVAYLLVLPLLLTTVAPASVAPALTIFLRIYYRAAYAVIMVMEAIGIGFLAEYDHRPDALFWDYLKYPDEVSQMLMGGYVAEIVGALATAAIAIYVGRRYLLRRDIHLMPGRWTSLATTVVVSFVGLLLLAMSIRSSLGHRPANISTAMFSDNRLANEVALNSFYTAGYALYARRRDSNDSELYGEMDHSDAIELVFNERTPSDVSRDNAQLPTVHRVTPTTAATQPRNLVIILQESLGARFVGALGGADLTPNFDRLSESGVLFTNLYATGTRTTRGIEAVLSGYPPSASQSIVKRSKSRRNFFTMAQLLKQHGYQNYFLYGGEPNFDDMGGFMLGNGFDSVIAGAAEYPDAEFVGSWGVSDEDWARRAHKEFEKANEKGPFFGLMLSTSNHSPWEFPEGRIEPGPGPLASRENSVRYADYAIGEFFALAQASAYFENTIFLVVADHDSRVYGDEFVPIDYFHIPGLIIGKGLAPTRYDRLSSQIDLMPTILPLLGITADSPMIGQDLFLPDLRGPGRALMQYGMNNALLRGDDVLMRLPGKKVRQFKRSEAGLVPAETDPQLAELSLAYLTLASYLYDAQVYRMPDVDAPKMTSSSAATVGSALGHSGN